MATPFDPSALFFPPFDGPDLASLQYPWSQSPVPPPGDPAAPAIAPEPAPVDALPIAGNPWVSQPAFPPPPAGPQAPAFPPPDALSGVGGMGPTGELSGVPFAARPTAEQHYGATVAGLQGGSPFDAKGESTIADPSERRRYLADLATRDPVKFAEVSADLEDVKTKRDLAEQLRIENENWARQQQIAQDRAAAMKAAQAKAQAIEADAQRIYATKVDPTGGLSGGQKIAGVLGAIIGGLVQGRTGAANNAGMDALNTVINRGIDAQKADLAHQREGLGMRRSLLADEVARHGDEFQAEEAIRLAAYKHAYDLLSVERQNYARGGTTDIKIANQQAQIMAAQQQARQAIAQKTFENGLKLQDASRQQQIADETARHNRDTTGLGYAGLASAAADRALQRQIHASEKDQAAQAAQDKIVRERSLGGEVTPITDAQGNVTGRKLGPLTTADGKVFVPTGTEQQISKLQEQHANTVKLLGTIDEIRRLGPEWLSDTANSDKLQKLKQLMGSARLQSIAANNLGVPTGHDIELAEDFIGTSDPTRRKASLAGIMSARDSLLRNHNVELKAHGLDKEWNPPDLVSKEKQPQPGDRELRDALRDPLRDPEITDARLVQELGIEQPDARRVKIIEALGANGGLLPSAKATFDALAAEMQDPDPKKREAASAKLVEASTKAATPAARAYVEQLISANAANSVAPGLPQVQEQVR